MVSYLTKCSHIPRVRTLILTLRNVKIAVYHLRPLLLEVCNAYHSDLRIKGKEAFLNDIKRYYNPAILQQHWKN